MNIFRGPTFKGAISFLGLIILIGGVVMVSLQFFTIPGIFLILIGLSLFLNIKGTIINFENGVITSYMYFLFIKIGSSYELNNYRQIDITIQKESIKMNSRATTGNYNIKEYSVSLINQSKEKILLKIFLKKEDALKYKDEIDQVLFN